MVRPRRRTSATQGPRATRGADAVDRYLLALDNGIDSPRFAALECDFVEHAKSFADQRGITWAAWRDVGVPIGVLARAGIDDETR